jgi:hypothetical protein
MTNDLLSALTFIVGLVVSTIIILWLIIFLATDSSSLVGGVIWLVALKVFYNIEWFKAFMITVVVWISATVIEFLLPTVPGSV